MTDTPCTTDKGSNISCSIFKYDPVDCACNQLNTAIDTAWKTVLSLNKELSDLDKFCPDLVSHAKRTSNLLSRLPTSLKHGVKTRPWRSLSGMFSSIAASREVLVHKLKTRKKEHLIPCIDVDLLNDTVAFLSLFLSLFGMLTYQRCRMPCQ